MLYTKTIYSGRNNITLNVFTDLLLNNEADPNIVDKNGVSPLILAGDTLVVLLILINTYFNT